MFDQTNINEVSFVALALQTQQEINDAYMRKMNRDYASHIGSSQSPSDIPSSIQLPITPNKEIRLE